jgi:hypothetical protein
LNSRDAILHKVKDQVGYRFDIVSPESPALLFFRMTGNLR